ncbi:hypothetical protein TNIN_164721 [Trichonephila inaurata madagascariensis]|uniref:Uncharacterized protein n=1 Tax=Trichonephila inaurata madagascariensis TaxID=2747483 RepID=A0A8X7CAP9_9ARAC|nr:hypothetical protein TNIN_164721 [Trichonephila inaurata madagascariensis]
MPLAHGTASDQRARQVYENRYPDRRIPLYQMFAHVHRNLCERGSLLSNMHDMGERRLKLCLPTSKKKSFEDNLNTTTQADEVPLLCQQCSGYCTSWMCILTICKGCSYCTLAIVQSV